MVLIPINERMIPITNQNASSFKLGVLWYIKHFLKDEIIAATGLNFSSKLLYGLGTLFKEKNTPDI